MKVKGPLPLNHFLRPNVIRQRAGQYAMLRPNMAQAFRVLDLHLDQLAEFPQGQEFYGKALALRQDRSTLTVRLEVVQGRTKVTSDLAATVSLADRFGELLDLPPMFIGKTTQISSGQLELRLEKPGNLLGQMLKLEPGTMVTSNRNSLPFSRKIRASYDNDTITVYQAFRPAIADEAVAQQRFGSHFSRERGTWIKPSFLWLMKRSDWGTKPGQERILAIRLERQAFEELLSLSVLSQPVIGISHPSVAEYRSAASRLMNRVQWDPEKSAQGSKLPQRSLQLGIHKSNLEIYLNGIKEIIDLTDQVGEIRKGQADLPTEITYPTPLDLLKKLEMHQYYVEENPALINFALSRLD